MNRSAIYFWSEVTIAKDRLVIKEGAGNGAVYREL
jgi:hypothetical protein